MTKQILILYTGGTIGMQRGPQGYTPMAGLAELIRSRIPLHLSGNMPRYELLELKTLIDSANVQPGDWHTMAKVVQAQYLRYDGFVVLHGTDTMAYTASALSFMLRGLDKPVIVTGSQIPLAELRNDAQDNLITAMILASHYPIAEVCLYFNGRLLRGNRATKVKASGFDAFDSPNYPWLGQVGIHIEINENALGPASDQPPAFELPEYGRHRVIPLRLFPGLDAALLTCMLQQQPAALILQSYGVGNAPDRDPRLLKQLERAIGSGVVVLNLSQCLYGSVDPHSYATGSTLTGIGVVAGGDMTLEAALTKLHHLLALGGSPDQVRQQVCQNRCGELS